MPIPLDPRRMLQGIDASRDSAWNDLYAALPLGEATERFESANGDDSVARYLNHAIRPGTLLAPAAILEMRGRLKLNRWFPFRARQLLAPRYGTVWKAKVGGVVFGSDRYHAGIGGMDWRLLGLVPVVRESGVDVVRSSAERAAGESIWVPTALAGDPSVQWAASCNGGLSVSFETDHHAAALTHQTDPRSGALRSSTFQRWGDPDSTGIWAAHPFGVDIADERTFEGVTIPGKGSAGWHHGTDRWEEGRFFDFEITKYELVTSSRTGP